MGTSEKPTFWQKMKNAVGIGKKGGCICKEKSPGQWYCYKWDSGMLVQCIGKGPFATQQECEAISCDS